MGFWIALWRIAQGRIGGTHVASFLKTFFA
jgi:hypothetical protein